MIKMNQVKVCIGDKCIVHDVSIHVKKGEFACIIGPNGCGKSTLIKALSGAIKLENGDVWIDGTKKDSFKRKELAKKIAYMMQFHSMPSGLTAREIIEFGRHPYINQFKGYTSYDYEVIERVIAQTNVSSLLDKNIEVLSGGERQRVFLAMALAQEPEILILDEPTNHLDMKYQYELLQLVKDMNQKHKLTIITVLHDINQALRFSDKIYVMKDGKIVSHGEPCKCICPKTIKSVYDIDCDICYRNQRYYLDIL